MSDNPFRHDPQTEREYLEAMYDTLVSVEAQVKITNGRVTILEQWRQDIQRKREADQAYQSGLAQALITKGQWRALAAVLAAITTVAATVGAVAGIVAKVWTA